MSEKALLLSLHKLMHDLKEEADNLTTARMEKYDGDWNYHEQDRIEMAAEARTLRRVADQITEIVMDIYVTG